LKLIEGACMGDTKAYCFTLTDMTSFCLSKSSMIVEEYDDDDMPKTIEEAMARKHAYNKTRPHRHGKKA